MVTKKNNKKKRKVILIGMDGLLPELIERYKDEIPELKKLLSKSFFSPALPSIYTDTPTNWTTIATGSWAGTHGITGFKAHLKGMELDETVPTFNSRLCQSEYFWQAAERQGKKSILINYPVAFPVTLKDGIVIGGDELTSKIWTVRGNDLIATFTNNSLENLGASKAKFATNEQYIASSNVTQIKMKHPEKWKDIPNNYTLLKEGIATLEEREKLDWGAAGGKKVDYQKQSKAKKEKRYILTVKDRSDNNTKVIISPERDFNKKITILSEGEWSGFIEERFNGVKCARQYKVLELSENGENIKIYGTLAGSLKGWGYPSGIEEEIIKNCGPFIEGLEVWFVLGLQNGWFGIDIALELMDLQFKYLEKLAKYLSNNKDWDVMFVQYHAPDGQSHLYQRDLEEKDERIFNRANYFLLETVRGLFKFADFIIKNCADESTIVCIVSDHGNMPQRYYVNAHGILLKEGLSKFIKNIKDGTWELDTKKSKAVFGNWHSGFWINLKGREKYGFVNKGKEYEVIRDKIISRFGKIVNPKTGELVFALVGRREDFECMGIKGERFPDVIAIPRPYYLFLEGTTKKINKDIFNFYENAFDITDLNDAIKVGILSSGLGSVHWQLPNAKVSYASNRGIVMLKGSGIVKNKRFDNVNLVDIAPTLAHILGIKPPNQSEGRIIAEAFK